jgi:hypothetical protein
MNKRKLVVEVEEQLMVLSGETSLEAKRHDDLFELSYTITRRAIEAARVPLAELGMYEDVVAAVDRAEALAKNAEYAAGSDLLFDTFQALMRKSGSYERYGRRYGKKADGSQPREPVAGELIDGCGDPGPDTYRGHFREMAPAQDQVAVSAMESALAVLRTEATIAHAGTGADVPGKFRVLRQATAKAEQPLEALGLYRLLLDTVAAAESFAGEGEYMEADELLEEFDRQLRQRVAARPAR